ncbi:MAG: Wzt carbohydrate-binding domain-containing protein, partial [Lautropia sp.]
DRLGQVIFGDNTFLASVDTPAAAEPGDRLTACFEFRMPVLPSGDYSIGVAIADGTQVQHVQHQWVHDALLLRAHASSVCFGLIGVPMKRITLRVSQTNGVRVDG